MLVAVEWDWGPDTVTAIGTVATAVVTALVGIFAIKPAVKAARAAADAYALDSEPLLAFEQPATTAEAIMASQSGEFLIYLDLRRSNDRLRKWGVTGQSGLLPSWVNLEKQVYLRVRNVGRTTAIDIQLE